MKYVSATDREAIAAFQELSRTEGIIPALESSHAVAHAMKLGPELEEGAVVVVCLSGSGAKDCMEVARILEKNP